MKFRSVLAVAFALFGALSFCVDSNAQFAIDYRPFDFRDKYYEENGIFAFTLIGRKNGADGASVMDIAPDMRFTNVRIVQTFPAYDADGETIFWNHYGDASKESFTGDYQGDYALQMAYAHPMYVFPSAAARDSNRQSAIIRMGDEYFEKNLLGLAAVYVVEYADRGLSIREQRTLQALGERNGLSLDGTPIIRTAEELDQLSSQRLVTITGAGDPRNNGRPGFVVAKVLRELQRGAISHDAFLVYVQEGDGSPLKAEAHLLDTFECYRRGGTVCF